MADLDIEVGKFRPEEVKFETDLDALIDTFAGRLTTAEMVGVMLKVYLDRLGVFDYE